MLLTLRKGQRQTKERQPCLFITSNLIGRVMYTTICIQSIRVNYDSYYSNSLIPIIQKEVSEAHNGNKFNYCIYEYKMH